MSRRQSDTENPGMLALEGDDLQMQRIVRAML